MTDETKELFDAPWSASYDGEAEMLEVYDADHDRVCIIDDFADSKHAERIARLPELYDALLDLLYTGCVNCYSATYQLMAHDAAPTIEFFLENRCPKGQRDCPYNKAWRLIKNVRDGE